jgi:hypothetical protein
VTIAASARFEFRLRPEAKSRIEQAAQLVHESTSDFARTAAEERANRVLQEHMLATIVPGRLLRSTSTGTRRTSEAERRPQGRRAAGPRCCQTAVALAVAVAVGP